MDAPLATRPHAHAVQPHAARQPPARAAALEGDEVAAYLRAHPGFLAENPELFHVLTPPARIHGASLADHMAAMIAAARGQARDMAAQAACVLAAGRATLGIAERVQEAVLAVLQAPDAVECVTETWPGLLGVDAAALLCEGLQPRWRSLPRGGVQALLGGRQLVWRDHPADAVMVHAEAAPLAGRDLLVALPGPRPALLALACRDAAALPATHAWLFLGRVLGALFDQRR